MAGSGSVNVNGGLTGDVIKFDGLQLGDAASDRQFFNVGFGATLEVDSPLSGNTGTTLAKGQPGTLILTNDNSLFVGNISIDPDGGILKVTGKNAAKSLGSSSNTVIVNSNGQLQLDTVTGAIQQNLILNGSGISNNGAILNVAGKNIWSGTVTMHSDVTFGASGPSTTSILDITGQISDGGAGHNVTKEGTGKVIFGSANTYRGTTTVNNGVLDIQNPTALGISDGGA